MRNRSRVSGAVCAGVFSALACGGDIDVLQKGPSDAGAGDAAPAACTASDGVEPLDDACAEEVCHVVLRFDYLTLEPRGWRVVGGPTAAINTDMAKLIATTAIEENTPNAALQRVVLSGPGAGLLLFTAPPDFGVFVLIGEQSGLVVAGGSMTYGRPGKYWSSQEWNPLVQVKCDSAVAGAPDAMFVAPLYPTCSYLDSTPPSDALEKALRTNIAASVASKGPFSAFVFVYTPDTSHCETAPTEFIVVLTQLRK